jgi:hypothetical protein
MAQQKYKGNWSIAMAQQARQQASQQGTGRTTHESKEDVLYDELLNL